MVRSSLSAVRCPLFTSSSHHLLDGQYEDGACAGALEAPQGLPEYVLSTDGVHCDFVRAALERHDRRCLAARYELADLGELRPGCVQHDVLAFLALLHAVDAQRQPTKPLLLLVRHWNGRPNDRRLAL